MITLTCEQCGKDYETKPYMAAKSKRHFCSMKCYGISQRGEKPPTKERTSKPCESCGKVLSLSPSQVGKKRFCSRQCKLDWMQDAMAGPNSPSWMGGHTCYRGPNWKRQATAAKKRDGSKCQSCGNGSGLDVHHKRPFHLFDDYKVANALENLITLCGKCHCKAEAKFWKENPGLIHLRQRPFKVRTCRKCGEDFDPRGGRQVVCNQCKTAICLCCGSSFDSDKLAFRRVKFCSRDCRNTYIKNQPKPCAGCSKFFTTNRGSKYCSHKCFIVHGQRRVATKHKPSARQLNLL